MPPWSIHDKWCSRLGCRAEVCREANYITDSMLVHDLGRRRVVNSDLIVRKVVHGDSHGFLMKFNEIEKALEKKIELTTINHKLRENECLRRAFYMHHILDVLLNTLIPLNNIFGCVKKVEELIGSALNYLDLIFQTISVSMPEPKDGFLLNYDRVRENIEKTLTLYKNELVSGTDERAWVKRMEKKIKRKISNACKFKVQIKFSWRYFETAKKQHYMPGIPSDMVGKLAMEQGVDWVLGMYRSKLVNRLMLCSGLYYYTLLNPWNLKNPLLVLKHVRKVLSDMLIDLWYGVDFDTAVDYALHRYPFKSYPYPEEIIMNLKRFLKKLFSSTT